MGTTNIRQAEINPNHWYVVARSHEVKTQPLGVKLWNQAIVLFRDSQGQIYALENRCPHRHVKLSHGKMVDNSLECIYHGWQFQGNGVCVKVPYLAAHQKLPTCQLRSYPVKDVNGLIWLFPGQPNLATEIQPLTIPEWEHLNYIATVSTIHCHAHYSFLIENLMDMYHGHLHQSWQAWTDAMLEEIKVNETKIDAIYQAKSYYKIDKIWSISQLFFPQFRKLRPEQLTVSYIYPHWYSTLGEYFTIYCLFCPISLTETKAYLIHFTSLNSFWRLHKLPIFFRQFVKNSLFGSAQKLLDGLVKQDIQMIEEEQQAYEQNPQIKSHEFNPAIVKIQSFIHQQTQMY
jgi:hypothetical protein